MTDVFGHETKSIFDTAEPEEPLDTEVDHVDRVQVDSVLEAAVDATLASAREKLLAGGDETIRKSVPVGTNDRRKVRRRHVDTDVAISDLVFDAVLKMLTEKDEIPAASERASKNRTERLTLTAPAWWWKLVTFAGEANGAGTPDVVAQAIRKHLG